VNGLPPSWAEAAFNDVVENLSTTGHVVDANELAPAGAFPVLTQGEVSMDGFTDDASRAYGTGLPLVVFGDHTRAIKIARKPFAVGPNTKVLSPANGILPEFLYYQMPLLLPDSRGYGRHFQFLSKSVIAVAPTAEQRRIVAAIEEQFPRLDAGAAALERVRTNLKRMRASVLQTAITGRRLMETTDARSEDNSDDRREGPFPLPTGWSWRPLMDICTSVTDGDHQAPPQSDRGIPFLVIGNVRTRTVDFAGCRHVPAEYYEALHPTRRPRRGDILYTLVGSFGISVLVTDDRPFCVQRHIGILRTSDEVSPKYLASALGSRIVFTQARACATGTAQMTVPLSGLRRILVPLPPRAQQERIAAELDRFDTAAKILDETLAALRARAFALRSAILAAAFSGTLAPQNSNDDPASALVNRIAARRTSAIHQRFDRTFHRTEVST
jgi:Type I restriction modification DNA specificity domain